jgi:hypothetical protein
MLCVSQQRRKRFILSSAKQESSGFPRLRYVSSSTNFFFFHIFTVDTDDGIKEIEHQLSTDNRKTVDSGDKTEGTTIITGDDIEEDT